MLIAFLKCRYGIYEKTNEFVTLTEVDFGVVVFSLAKKGFLL